MNYTEATMSEPLSKWLGRQKYCVYTEVRPRWAASSIDMVGYRRDDDSFVVIEMKKNLTIESNYRNWRSPRTSVVEQALKHRQYTENIFCAVLSNPRERGLQVCRERGLGVLRVDVASGVVHRLVEPHRGAMTTDCDPGRIRCVLEHMESGGVAGMPNMKGVGPAQAAYDLLVEYKAKNPDATWKEIYRDVPNHYSSMSSMRGALGKIEEWRYRDGVLDNKPLYRKTQRLMEMRRRRE